LCAAISLGAFAALPRRIPCGAWLQGVSRQREVAPFAVAGGSLLRQSSRPGSRSFASATARRAAEQIPGMKTTYEVVSPGKEGKVVAKKSLVTVHATGVVKETGKKFWSTKDPGQEPFTYTAGVGEVITGWDKGCLGMQEGEERLLVIPAAEGYGAGGFPAWGIPPGGTLEFTLECLKIK
ncbi:unnamed protein product, partial [Polarella glacialis]